MEVDFYRCINEVDEEDDHDVVKLNEMVYTQENINPISNQSNQIIDLTS